MPENNIDHLLDDGIKDQHMADNSCFQELTSQHDLRKQAIDEHLKVSNKFVHLVEKFVLLFFFTITEKGSVKLSNH